MDVQGEHRRMAKETAKETLPLAGVRVLEVAGPPGTWATGLLADFGADVIKVVRAPLPSLRFGVTGMVPVGSVKEQEKSAAFDSHDRNKSSIALNLKTRDAVKVFYRLVETSDVVVEGYRPGVSQRLGIDYDTLQKINSRIIYCAITGYGQDGPYRELAGHDINYIALAGVLNLTGKHDDPPVLPGVPVGDLGGGCLPAVIGILLALRAREKSGQGQFVDISMTDGVLSWMMGYAIEYFCRGFLPERERTVPTGAVPWNNVYETRDKKYISIGCWEPWLYENLCRALGREDFIPHQYATGEVQDRIFQTFREIFRSKTRDEWFHSLKDKDIPVAPVYALDEVFSDPQVLHRKMLLDIKHPTIGSVKQVGVAIKLSQTPGRVKNLAPLPGQDSQRILQELGYSEKDIERLREEGATV